MARFHIEGLDKLRRDLANADQRTLKQLSQGLFVEGNKIMTRSKQSFVPVDQGTLRASGHVQKPVVKKTTASVTLGFGGAASAYALVQHERLEYAHTVGQAKYLEQPVHDAAAGFAKRVGKHVDLMP